MHEENFLSSWLREDVVQRGTAEQIVDRLVFKDFSLDRVQQRCIEQNIENPVPQMLEELEEVPHTVSPNRIQPWTAEQIVDMPVPKVVEHEQGSTALRGAECLPRAHLGVSMCRRGKWMRCPSI